VSASVVGFEDEPARDPAHAGGKVARLAGMAGAGLPVPPGFAVCADAWRAFLAADDRERRIADVLAGLGAGTAPGALADASRRLGALVAAEPFPAALDDAVRARYAALGERLGTPDPPVAVRSSATLEDAATESFAGQYETYLWVRGADAVIHGIRGCWAGLFSATGLAYAAHSGISVLDSAMAVAVQSMVRSRCSGVMFTLDPRTGDPSVVSIEGAWGLGSAVVGGEVTPDGFVVAKAGMWIRERRVHAKEIRHVPDPAGGGVRVEPVPAELRETACLNDEEVLELARLGRAVERLYGGPQDIEWGLDERLAFPDCVFLLQARPETVWSRRRAEPVLDPGTSAPDWIARSLTKGA
jgi:pyruvate, water dikinase